MTTLKDALRKHSNADLYRIRKGRVPDSIKTATIDEILRERLLLRGTVVALVTVIAVALLKGWVAGLFGAH